VLVVTRYTVPVDEAEAFRELGRTALAALAARPGCLGGSLGRNVDEPTLWVLATTWENVGAYRRALSAYEVKLHAVPLMYRALDEPTAFEYLATAGPGGLLYDHEPSRAADADVAAPGRPHGPRAVPPDE
jgi:quinol monooxygenase YgiN